MKLCVKNKKWKLEKNSTHCYIRFYGLPWYRKLIEYILAYFCLFFFIPILFVYGRVFLRDMGNIHIVILLVIVIIAILVCLKFTTEFRFVVVRLNFKKKYLAITMTMFAPYKTLLLDIEKKSELYRLFLTHPNFLVSGNGRVLASHESVKGENMLRLKIWESDTYEEIENVKNILLEEYEKGMLFYSKIHVLRKNVRHEDAGGV